MNRKNSIQDDLKRYQPLIEAWLGAALEEVGQDSPIFESLQYVVKTGGKRLRPSLCLLVGESLGLSIERLRPVATALEYLHSSSLIHDDLPCIDNDQIRRGKPCCHVVFGEATALLAGNALNLLTFLLISRASVASKRLASLVSAFAEAGVQIQIGQLLDVRSANRDIQGRATDSRKQAVNDESPVYADLQGRIDLLNRRHQAKTGALIALSVLAPLYFLDESSDFIETGGVHLGEFGRCLGLLFQITDDLLDETATTPELGKTAGKDAALGVETFTTVYGLEGSRTQADKVAKLALEHLTRAGLADTVLGQLPELIRHRES